MGELAVSTHGHTDSVGSAHTGPTASSSMASAHAPFGAGGKHTIGAAGFENISSKYLALEKSLPAPPSSLTLALLLSVRMSLGYLTREEIGKQLEGGVLGVGDGEACLRIWVGRRLPGEGRFNMGKILEGLEKQVSSIFGVLRIDSPLNVSSISLKHLGRLLNG